MRLARMASGPMPIRRPSRTCWPGLAHSRLALALRISCWPHCRPTAALEEGKLAAAARARMPASTSLKAAAHVARTAGTRMRRQQDIRQQAPASLGVITPPPPPFTTLSAVAESGRCLPQDSARSLHFQNASSVLRLACCSTTTASAKRAGKAGKSVAVAVAAMALMAAVVEAMSLPVAAAGSGRTGGGGGANQ